ncbi:MAG: glycerate kinase [Desulfovibrio sp.]|uniref:glycerate kinase family protein n=1 Tax=Desulfovibrio sp. 7SRBS1 TaxID=3378064 RepID=UPI003B3C4F22
MNVLVAMDSFKGSLSTNELADAVAAGILGAVPDARVVKTPIADGGEGFCDTLLEGLGGRRVTLRVKGPLFEPISASYGILENGAAIMEMASVAGLPLVPEHLRNPLETTTFGLGEMIRDAMDKGCREFIIGLGGSATNDGGMGMAAALGYDFLDSDGNALEPVGRSLGHIAAIRADNVVKGIDTCRFLAACDVENPLCGPNGAAHVYGPQKGAGPEAVRQLDQGLQNLARVIARDLGKSVDGLAGAGAAGGLGGGLSAFLPAELRPGVDIIFEQLGMEELINAADLVFTGEGRLDFQSVMGKAPLGIAKLAARRNTPVIALAGSVADDADKANAHGVTAMFSVMDGPMALREAMEKGKAGHLVSKTVRQIMGLVSRLTATAGTTGS